MTDFLQPKTSKRAKIADVFSPEQLAEFTLSYDQKTMKGVCPSCGCTDNYSGFTLFLETNTGYCHTSKTCFDVLEAVALVKGIICCKEGRSKK